MKPNTNVQRQYQEQGFTLIEMIIVIALIAVMIAFTIPNLRDGRSRQEVRQARDQFTADLRFAQSLATEQNIQKKDQAQVYTVGVYINKAGNSYTIFEDSDTTAGFSGDDIVVKKVALTDNAFIKTVNTNVASPGSIQDDTSLSALTVTFLPTTSGAANAGSPMCLEESCQTNVYFRFAHRLLSAYSLDSVANASGLIQNL